MDRTSDPERPRLMAALAGVGVSWDQVSEVHRLGGGTFNTVFHVGRTGDTALVVKLAPGPETPVMSYERGILSTEARYYRLAGAVQHVPLPEVLPSAADSGPSAARGRADGAVVGDCGAVGDGGAAVEDRAAGAAQRTAGAVARDGALAADHALDAADRTPTVAGPVAADRVPSPAGSAEPAGSAAAPVDHLVMTECPGATWYEQAQHMGNAERRTLREALGRQVAALHTLTADAFGYPAEPFGPLSSDWRSAFLDMVDAVLADADRFAVRLPRPTAEVRELFEAQSPVLDEVTVPTLVHFDLWDGNILVDRDTGGPPRITALIDAERAFWGDPLAEFVSLALFGDIEEDDAFLTGYRSAGGSAVFDTGARRRLALYRCYLHLIMWVEATPRAYDAERRAWLRTHVLHPLTTTFDEWTRTPRPPTRQ
jgi:aminoglycoside phosphotransferase (APT) family kinase protein